MIEWCIAAKFDVLAPTVDTITGGNREHDLRTGFTSPSRFTLNSVLSFAMHPRWAASYFTHKNFELPQLKDYVKQGSNISVSVGGYFSTMLDQAMNWQDAAEYPATSAARIAARRRVRLMCPRQPPDEDPTGTARADPDSASSWRSAPLRLS